MRAVWHTVGFERGYGGCECLLTVDFEADSRPSRITGMEYQGWIAVVGCNPRRRSAKSAAAARPREASLT